MKWLKRGLIALMLIGVFVVIAMDDPNAGLYRQAIQFNAGDNQLTGELILPESTETPHQCVVFVHGSGDVPIDAFGYYLPLWRVLAANGWCAMSWHKPGVGDSSGDWRSQSMQDRADEVAAAIRYLRQTLGLKDGKLGLMGFSQAGWVIPKVAHQVEDIDFLISVGGAVNWMAQSEYSGRQRRLATGYSESESATEQAAEAKVDALIQSDASYQQYLDHVNPDENAPMSEAFWQFVQLNWASDVTNDLIDLDVPMLALFGAQDAYVDSDKTASTYHQRLANAPLPFYHVRVFEHADHSLLRTDNIANAHSERHRWLTLARIWWQGDAAFADGVMPCLTAWLAQFESGQPRPTTICVPELNTNTTPG
ncbi:alpha/beta hydrolase [Salinivibrio sp. EAGSL]|uniref:alpha/beta hydrolase family protein n=1 Tax=Salinivibrio sp. EAGSL TaxID=2738468 RepID=UPI001588FA7D|nr:alpha/beta hydrolase [Salinivibrio sp. EAGSL]NUY56156.1 alpha/beta hydrolase [Salinivibrio sp. EAGSL]